MAEPRLLCVAYGGGHVRACLPALAELRERGWHIDLLALTTAYAEAVEAGFAPWQVRDLLAPADAAMLAQGRRLAAELPPHPRIAAEETAAYLAFGYLDLVASNGEKGAAAIYADRGRRAFAPRTLAARAIHRSRPDVVLATNSPRAEKAVIDEAQARGIPAVVLNDLLASPSNTWLHDPGYADRILVLNDLVRDRLLASGHRPGKLVTTGNPAFASMIELRERRRGRPADCPTTVLFASQSLPPAEAELARDTQAALVSLARRRREWRVSVRLHPSEAGEDGWLVDPLVHRPGLSLEEDLETSDVVVTHGSTVGLQAALAGVRVVQQLGSRLADDTRFDRLGFAIASKAPDELERAIERALAAPVPAGLAMPSDPARRVADEISKVFDGK